jgi:serine/threonine-protein kinase
LALTPGTRVGVYEVVAQIGVGGMGEVYRARDTKLDRAVAIKILPDAFAHDPERLARFEREAKTLAALNHSNIAIVHGFEQSNGIQALVMELVEGPTLADRIAQGPVPVDEALAIGKQIADALEAAHGHGIIHRDLKPANIKLRPDGTVKVLDFGLAKALTADGSGTVAHPLSYSPTITSPVGMTGMGVILGTAAYMAPEQARGKTVDKRADIWAFGCVLYEMLTGRQAFEGAEVSDVLARIIERQPDFDALPRQTPAAVRRLLTRCLQKNRKRRLADVADARLEIEDALTTPASDVPAILAISGRDRWRRLATVIVAVVVAAGAAGGAVWIAMRPGPARVTRTTIQTSGDTALVNTISNNLAITPDGSRVVYGGSRRLLVRRLDQLEPTTLTGVGSPTAPFIAPDGQWVGFFDGAALKKVAITGGPPVTVVPSTFTGSGSPLGATWSPQGTIVFATSGTRGLRRVSAAGGNVETLTTPDRARGEIRHIWPEFLPDGKRVLFTVTKAGFGVEAFDIVLLDLEAGTQSVLIRGGNHARYLRSGHLVYGAGDTLHAVAFDLKRRAVVGTPVPALAAVGSRGFSAYELDVAADGTLVYLPSGALSNPRTLVWVDRQGRETPLGAPARPYMHPRLAPDGTRVVVLSFGRDQRPDLWMWDLARATLTRAVIDEAGGTIPLWTPDNRRLIFSSNRDKGRQNLFVRPTDGTGTTVRLTESAHPQHPTGITPDGTQIVFYEATPTQQRDIRMLTVTAPSQVTSLVATRFDEGGAVVSPDGRWLAYESNRTDAYEIYVSPFPLAGGGIWPVSTAGGEQPLWARNGRELFYVAPDGALMAVPVEAGGSIWSAGAPVRLFAGEYYRGAETIFNRVDPRASTRQYDVAADGRFLMIKEDATDTDAAPSIVVVQNWFEELKRLVPTK